MSLALPTVEEGTVYRDSLVVTELPTGTSEEIPVIIAEGVEPGPTIWLTGAIHGDEATGMAVCQDVVHEGLPDRLSGQVVSLPNLNPAGLRCNTRTSYYDGDNPNRKFPDVDYVLSDNPDPTEPVTDEKRNSADVRPPDVQEVICRNLFDLFADEDVGADMLLDVHTAQVNSFPFIIKDRVLHDGEFGRTQADAEELAGKVAEMGDVFGLPVVFEYGPRKYVKCEFYRSTAGAALNMAGIPALTVELGSYHVVEDEWLAAGIGGVYRIMEHEGMIEDAHDAYPDEQGSLPTPVNDPARSLWSDNVRKHRGPYANTSGIVRHAVEAGDIVKNGDLVAEIHPPNADPEEVKQVTAEHTGWIIQRENALAKYVNDPVTLMAVKEKESTPIGKWDQPE